jgi:hypothetical protein
MGMIDPKASELTRKIIRKEKIFTLSRLVALMECSPRTAQTKLSIWQTYTSYNKNGKYYTLPEVPAFDDNGIWLFRQVAFSCHGNLKKTVVHLSASSPAGLTGRQLGDILGMSPQSFLHHFRNCPGIRREKHDGVYTYFSDDDSVYERQIRQRRKLRSQASVYPLSDSEAILVLVAIIRNHGISAEEILALPEIRKSKVTLTALERFLEYHGLVKKNADTAP